jgi:hypothetical protein
MMAHWPSVMSERISSSHGVAARIGHDLIEIDPEVSRFYGQAEA